MKTRLFKLILLSFLAIGAAVSVSAETAIVCEDCDNVDSAVAFAKSKANQLECSPMFGFDVSCQSRNKVITFVDANSGQAYKYNVYHDRFPPWDVQADRISLSSDREESFRKLMGFINDTNEAIREASSEFEYSAGYANQNYVSASTFSAYSSTDSCPSDTALSALVDPNALDFIKEKASIEIGTRIISRNNDINLNPIKLNNSWSINFRGLSSTIVADSPIRKASFIVTFDESERPSSRKDFFAYSVDILGFDEQNLPIINFTLTDASRVAGYSLGALRGNDGPLKITNECIQEKFEQAVENGILGAKVTTVGGSGGGGLPETPSSGGGGSYQPSCQIIEFSQGGRLLYVFRICN